MWCEIRHYGGYQYKTDGITPGARMCTHTLRKTGQILAQISQVRPDKEPAVTSVMPINSVISSVLRIQSTNLEFQDNHLSHLNLTTVTSTEQRYRYE